MRTTSLPRDGADVVVEPPAGCGTIGPRIDTCCGNAQETSGPIEAGGKQARNGGETLMKRLKIRCPNCGKVCEIADENLGARAVCKHCRQTFTIGMDQSITPPAIPQPAAAQSPASAGSDAEGPCEGKRIGHYVLKEKLGAGAMGEVWKARDRRLTRDVAIKFLPRVYTSDDERLKRFLTEARSAGQLDHTNAVTIYEINEEKGIVYIVMQYVAGDSLDKVVAKCERMDWRDATRVIRDAAAGLGAAHKRGIIHRDVKPANLLRDPEGVTRVADFGLAKPGPTHSRSPRRAPFLARRPSWRRNSGPTGTSTTAAISTR